MVFNGPQEELLSVVINGQPTHKTYLFLCPSSSSNAPLYARKKDLKEWRMLVPSVAPLVFDGIQFYPLDDVAGVTYRIDNATQTLYITSPSGAFQSTVVDGFSRPPPKLQKTPWGGFLNYDFLGSHASGQTIVDGLFGIGLFNGWGVGTSNFLDQNITHSGSHLIRLDTAWRHDDPGNMTTLTIGDSITRGGQTGLDVRFGGLQYGTNFATQPYFITFPMPGLSGNAAVPSTVDLYVNNVLKSTQQVPSGPFTVPSVPVVTGPGQVTMVVRNALGQQQVITTSFYASSSLLKQGLDDYSFSVGKLRENYGLDSNDYKNFLATGLFRHGFTQHLTGEVRGEFSNLVNDVSLGATFANTTAGAVNAALAASHSKLGSGALVRLGLQRQWTHFSLGADLRFASPRFTEVGYNGLPAPRKQIAVTAGEALGRGLGSLYASYLDQQSPLFGRSRLVTAGYSVNVGSRGFLNLSAFHTIGGSSNNGFSLSFSISFGQRTSLSTGVSSQNGNMLGYAQLQRSLPVGTGSGYRIGTQIGSGSLTQAEYDYQNDVGTYSVGAYRGYGSTVYQAEASGGLAFIGGGIYPSRKIDGAFALVKVPGMSGVTVYSANQPVATTNKNGNALVPDLLPYQNNPLSLGANSLPLGAQVNKLDANAVPRYKSGVIEKFPVTNTRGATFTVKVRGGKYLPAGAQVHIVGQAKTFPVGLDGEVYLTGLSSHNIVEASWGNQVCRMVINMPAKTKDPIPDLGTFQCEGIHF